MGMEQLEMYLTEGVKDKQTIHMVVFSPWPWGTSVLAQSFIFFNHNNWNTWD